MTDALTTSRTRRIAALIGGAVVVLAAGGLAVGLWESHQGPDRSDPASTATAFLQTYAVHDPAVCELITPTLNKKFTRDGRCGGTASGQTPTVQVFSAQPCGNKALVKTEVNPAGEVGQRYALVGLNLTDQQWQVNSLLPISDRQVATEPPAACATHSSYGG